MREPKYVSLQPETNWLLNKLSAANICCSIVNLDIDIENAGLSPSFCITEVPLYTEEPQKHVMQQVCSVIAAKFKGDATLADLCGKTIESNENYRISHYFMQFMMRLSEFVPKRHLIILTPSQLFEELGPDFINALQKLRATEKFGNFHFACICKSKEEAERDRSILGYKLHNIIDLIDMKDNKSIAYISHTWSGKSDKHGRSVYEYLNTHDIPAFIDCEQVKYNDDIRDFENELTHSPFVVATVSSDYFHSLNASAELATIFRDGNVEARLFPILCETTRDCVAPEKQHELENYWIEKKKEYEQQLINPETGTESLVFRRKVAMAELIISQLPAIFQYFENKNIVVAEDFFAEGGYDQLCNQALVRLGLKNFQATKEEISQAASPTIGTQINNAEKQNIFNAPVTIQNLN